MKKIVLNLSLMVVFGNAEMIRSEGSEVVFDTETKLVWQNDNKTVQKKWHDAVDYCKNLHFFGFDDWKLPSAGSLKALIDKKAITDNEKACRSSDDSFKAYWSSTQIQQGSSWAWTVFSSGFPITDETYNENCIRCVRDSRVVNYDSLSLFFQSLKKITPEKEKILLGSSHVGAKEFLIKHNGKSYWGTKESIFAQLINSKTPVFSTNPFVDIQIRTEDKLNNYFSIAMIPEPILPPPLNLLKDEFESKVEFNTRVQQEGEGRELEIIKIQKKYRKDVEARNNEVETRKYSESFIEEIQKGFLFQSFKEVMGDPKLFNPVYDPETNTMFVDVSVSNASWSKKIGIGMGDRIQAKAFKNAIEDTKVNITFVYENDSFVLTNIDVDFASKNYVATLTDTDYKSERVAVTLENKKVAFNELQNPNLVDKYQVSALGYSDSASAKGLKYTDDLAPLVKAVKQSPLDPKKWLFAISVEKYDEADPVIYATNSANSFISVMQKRLGIDERHTYALLNEKATTGGIKGSLERLLQNVQPGDSIYFYYSGHGIPDPKEGEPYILPRDVIADYVTREKDLMARSIYKKLSDSSASRIVAFIDSCYSGRTDDIPNIKGAAAGHFKSKQVEFDKTKMAVFTAGTNGQFSNAFPEKGNRLFSYYLTKALATKENLDLDTLSAEVYANVKEESLKMGDIKRQEPQIEGNRKIGLR